MALKNKTVSAGALDILNIDGGLDASTAGNVLDGNGTASPLWLTTTKVGIGTSTPDYLLDVEATTATLRINSTGDNNASLIQKNTSGEWLQYITPTTGNWKLKDVTHNVTPITVEDNSADNILYLNEAGNVGINETSPDNHLHVTVANGNDNTYVAKFENKDTDNPNGILINHSGGDFSSDVTHDTADHTAIQYSDNNSGVFSVFGDGDVVNEDNSYTSDIRIKTNVVDATSKLDELLKLKVRNFHYKDSDGNAVGKKRLGFVADEFETVFPSLIKKRKIKKIGVEFDDLKTITASVLVPILVKAVQELSAKVTALENA